MNDAEQYQNCTILENNIATFITYIKSGHQEEAWRIICLGDYSLFKKKQWEHISVEQKIAFFEALEIFFLKKNEHTPDKMLKCCEYALQLAQTLQLPEVEKKLQHFYIYFDYHCNGAIHALLGAQLMGSSVSYIEQTYYAEISKDAKRREHALQSAAEPDLKLLEKIISEVNLTVQSYIAKKNYEAARTFYRIHLLPLLKYKMYLNEKYQEIIDGMELLHSQTQKEIRENSPILFEGSSEDFLKFVNKHLDQLVYDMKDIHLSRNSIFSIRLDYEKMLLPLLRHPEMKSAILKTKIEETLRELNQFEINFYSRFIANYRIQNNFYLKIRQIKLKEIKSEAIEKIYTEVKKLCGHLILHYKFDEAIYIYEMLHHKFNRHVKLCQKIEQKISLIHTQKLQFISSNVKNISSVGSQQNFTAMYQAKIRIARNLKMPIYITHNEETLLLSAASQKQKIHFYQEMISLQKDFTQNMNMLVQEIFQDCLSYLGQPPFPCAFTLIALGSMGNHTMAPYSDLEAALLIEHEHPDNISYFKSLVDLLRFKLLLIGEGIPEKIGFCADEGLYPEARSLFNEYLCTTPEKMAGYYKQQCCELKKDPGCCITTELATSLLKTDIIYASPKIFESSGEDLYRNFFTAVQEHQTMIVEWQIPNCQLARARALYGLLERFKNPIDIFEKSDTLNIKFLLRLLEDTLVYLCHYKGIYVRTPEQALIVVDKLFSPDFIVEIQSAIATLAAIRYRHHLNLGYRADNEVIFQHQNKNGHKKDYIVNSRELANICYIQVYVIEPLQHYFIDAHELSLEMQYFQLNKKLIKMKNWHPLIERVQNLNGEQAYEKGCKLLIANQYKEALPYFEASIQKKYYSAYLILYYLYKKGLLGKRDDPKSQEYYQKTCENINWFLERAKAGLADAQKDLGFCYYHGMGVEQNYEEAIKYYQLAAAQGNISAIENLKKIYKSGECAYKKGIEHLNANQYRKALPYLEVSIQKGHYSACLILGFLYQKEDLLGGRDDERSQYYYRKASKHINWFLERAETGSADAQKNLGFCYYHGIGVNQNFILAVQYYKLAADNGDAAAQFSVGFFYEKGEGVEQSDEMAMKYYQLSANQGNKNASENLESLKLKIDESEKCLTM